MTDKKIIKALECCSSASKELKCHNCIAHVDGRCTMRPMHALDLIKRQQVKIERLTINMNAFGLGMKREKEKADIIRAETIKEFAERLKKSIKKSVDDAWHSDGNGIYDAENVLDDIDNLVKEMTESESKNEENQA